MHRIEPLEKYNELSNFNSVKVLWQLIPCRNMQNMPYLWIKQSNYVKFHVQPNFCTTMPLDATFDHMTQSGWAANKHTSPYLQKQEKYTQHNTMTKIQKLHHLGDPVSRIFIHLENFRPRVSSSNVKSFQYGFELFIRDMRNPTAWKWLNEMSNFWSGNAYYFDLISKQCRLSTKICTWFQLATGCKKIPNIPWLLPSKRINLVRTKLGSIHWVYIVLWLTWEFEGDQGQQP